ncbi:MAG: GGDEF domain-containing protein [Burkholderiales bacterium]
MELDPRSLIATSLLSAALMGAVSVAFASVRRSNEIIGTWGQAMLIIALGLVGLLLRGTIPFWISSALATALIVGGLVLAMRGLRGFLGVPVKDLKGWSLVGVLFLLLLYFAEVSPSHIGRTISVSTALAYIAASAAILLRRNAREDCRLSCRFAEIIFWGVAAMSVTRIVLTLAAPPATSLQATPINVAAYAFYSGFIIVSTLAVMWMEIESLQAELVRAARYDALTGLQNRASCLAAFEREASRCERGAPAFSLAIFDLDHFTRLNDEHGHPFGDRVLKAFAGVLKASIRKHDIVGRYGGEEFALLMPGTAKDTALRVTERVRGDLEARGITLEGKRVDVTVSGGVSTYGEDGADWDSLLRAADDALYRAKEGGRNRIVSSGTPGTA